MDVARSSGTAIDSTLSTEADSHPIYLSLPLDASNKEVRFLRIFPGEYNEPIRTELFVETLHRDEHKFKTLSYTWDHVGPKVALEVNGLHFSISEDLHLALRKIRKHFGDQNIAIWIDAICIDQSSITERNSQVLLMRDIYSKTDHPLVWLGDGDANTDLVIERLKEMKPGPNIELPDPGNPNSDKNWLDGIKDIFSRGWFRRTWILQELSLPEGDPLLLIGDSTILWECFSMTLDSIASRMSHQTLGHGEDYEFVNNFPIEALQIMRGTYHVLHDIPLAGLIQLSVQSLSSDPRDKIYGLLGMCDSTTQHVIPVDYRKSVRSVFLETVVYNVIFRDGFQFLSGASILDAQFANDWPSWLPYYHSEGKNKNSSLSHSRLIEEGYMRASIYNVSRFLIPKGLIFSDTSMVVCHIPIGPVEETHSTLPNTGISELQTVISLFFQAGNPCGHCGSCILKGRASETAAASPCSSPIYAPQIPGLRLDDSIQPTGSLEKDTVHECNHVQCIKYGRWNVVISQKSEQSVSDRPSQFRYSRQKPLKDAVWRTLIGDHLSDLASDMDGAPAPSDAEITAWDFIKGTGLVEGVQWIPDPTESVSEDEKIRYWKSFRRVTDDRVAFRTTSGWIGLGPTGMRRGDSIAVLIGADVPFVLRPIHDDRTFQVVGECFVEGLMFGELFEGCEVFQGNSDSKLIFPSITLV